MYILGYSLYIVWTREFVGSFLNMFPQIMNVVTEILDQ